MILSPQVALAIGAVVAPTLPLVAVYFTRAGTWRALPAVAAAVAYWVGQRFALPHTRGLVHTALRGDLEGVPMRKDPYFGFEVPELCPGVSTEILNPRQTWKNPQAYDQQAKALAQKFKDNFKQFTGSVTTEVAAAGPGRLRANPLV